MIPLYGYGPIRETIFLRLGWADGISGRRPNPALAWEDSSYRRAYMSAVIERGRIRATDSTDESGGEER